MALLGWDTADRLFKGQNPIDKVIQINGVHFRVLGVNEKKGSVFGNSQDEFAVIPLGSFQKMFGARRSLDLTIKPSDPSQLNAAMDEARVALRMKRHLRPNQPDNFGMYTSDTLMDFWRNFSKGAFAILIGVVSLSLVVGGIVIMNIMLMVVSERTREIGLRKALGARRRDIVWQVLTESTTLSIIGGVLGTIFGFTAAWLVDVSKAKPRPLPRPPPRGNYIDCPTLCMSFALLNFTLYTGTQGKKTSNGTEFCRNLADRVIPRQPIEGVGPPFLTHAEAGWQMTP